MFIGSIPRFLQCFFKPLRRHFQDWQWDYVAPLLIVWATMTRPRKLWHLAAALPNRPDRTCLADFMQTAVWDEDAVLQEAAIGTLLMMSPRPGERLYLVIDENKLAKRAKKMDSAARHYNPSQKTYAVGHTILRTALVFRGVRVPWRLTLMPSKAYCRQQRIPYQTLTARAAQIVREFLPPVVGLDVVVLADSYYCCAEVLKAAEERQYGFLAPAKSNRRLDLGRRGQRPRLDAYGANVLRRRGKSVGLGSDREKRCYRVATAEGRLKKMGHVFMTFSRRRGRGGFLSLVSNDPKLVGKEAVAAYENRWSIELLIKEDKQNLGWSHYQMLAYRGISRHLHCCALAHILLTHQAIKSLGAKARKSNTVLRLQGLSQLQDHLRAQLWKRVADRLAKTKRQRKMLQELAHHVLPNAA